jgi:hypothetical protein
MGRNVKGNLAVQGLDTAAFVDINKSVIILPDKKSGDVLFSNKYYSLNL